jgi:replicative DNA helicase
MTTPAQMIEEAVLGGVMVWRGPWPSEVLELEPEYFTAIKRAQIWEAAQALIRAHHQVDEVTLTAQLVKWDVKGRAAYLHDLAEATPTSEALVDWARLLVDDGLKRKARMAVKDALARCDGDTTPDEIAAAVNDAVRNVHGSGAGGPKHISSGVVLTMRELEQEHMNPGSACIAQTGLTVLDRETELRAGDLTIIAGRPSMGKSALAGNIAQHCARNVVRGIVAVFSLEMSLTRPSQATSPSTALGTWSAVSSQCFRSR